MGQRADGNPSLQFRGVVSQSVSHDRVAKFVERKANNDGWQHQGHIHQPTQRIGETTINHRHGQHDQHKKKYGGSGYSIHNVLSVCYLYRGNFWQSSSTICFAFSFISSTPG